MSETNSTKAEISTVKTALPKDANAPIVVEAGFNLKPNSESETIKGFRVRILFENYEDLVAHAKANAIVRAQDVWRKHYAAHNSMLYKPGQVVTVTSMGQVSLTPEEKQAQAQAQLIAQIQNDPKAKVAFLKQLGMTDEQISALGLMPTPGVTPAVTPDVPRETEVTVEKSDESSEVEYQYEEDELRKLSIAKLRRLAQDEELEGYDELTKEELVTELALIEK